MTEFNEGLHNALLKTEIEYRAKNGKGWQDNMVAGLNGSSPQALARDLRRIGFRVKRIVDTEPDTNGWVETTNGILVFAWTDEDIRAGERRCQVAKTKG